MYHERADPNHTPRLELREFTEMELREFTESDCEAVHVFASDAEVVRFQDWGPNSVEQTRDFIAQARDAASEESRTRYALAVILQNCGNATLIGSCELVVEREHEAGIIGYSLARQHWGRGYATEAASLLLRLGFDSLGLHRISATADIRNVASWRVLEKVGMRREAHFREHMRQRGEWRDSVVYAILEGEWRSLQAP